MTIHLQRVYDPPAAGVGARFLVDALWPRGLAKEQAMLTAWLRPIAPGPEVRKRYHGQTGGSEQAWQAFVQEYHAELDRPSPAMAAAIAELAAALADGPVTLLYAARDTRCNNAVALRQWIVGRAARKMARTPQQEEERAGRAGAVT